MSPAPRAAAAVSVLALLLLLLAAPHSRSAVLAAPLNAEQLLQPHHLLEEPDYDSADPQVRQAMVDYFAALEQQHAAMLHETDRALLWAQLLRAAQLQQAGAPLPGHGPPQLPPAGMDPLPVPQALQQLSHMPGASRTNLLDEPFDDKEKRGNYMSLCHFKICNMGRKRNLRNSGNPNGISPPNWPRQ